MKQGVQFHDDWGEMTADDVAWSFNDLISPTSTHNQSGDYSANFGEMEVIDEYTVRIPVISFSVVWNQSLFNTFAGTNGTFSKDAFDEMGRDWALENIVATGPYQLVDFRPQEVVRLESFSGHHTQPAPMQFMEVRDVPEESTRLAMLQNGQADIADISLKRITALQEEGFRTSASGKASQMAVIFAGNYWEQYDHNCSVGAPSVSCPDLEPGNPEQVEVSRPGYTPDEDHPWIGEYGNEASMERARKVRQAMALAIDVESINDAILDGLGGELYMNSFSPRSPHWDSKWEWDYDLDEAQSLLDEAGYPSEGGDPRFEVNLYVTGHAGGPLGAAGEMQTAIGAMWTEIGIPTSLDRRDYGTWRPTVVERSQNQPFVSACGGTDARDSVPWDFPKGVAYT
ncbi:MAG: ABC transporter substrate-binding protein, partial [Chloroflexota bacterium]